MIVRAVDVAAALSILAIFYSVGWIVRAARRARITLNIPEQIGPPPPPSSGPSSASAHETNVDNEIFIKVLKLLKSILECKSNQKIVDDSELLNFLNSVSLPNGQKYQFTPDQINLIKTTFLDKKIDDYIDFVKNFINADTTGENKKYDKFLDMLNCSNGENTITKNELINTFFKDNDANTRIDKNAMTEHLNKITKNNKLTRGDLIIFIQSIINSQ